MRKNRNLFLILILAILLCICCFFILKFKSQNSPVTDEEESIIENNDDQITNTYYDTFSKGKFNINIDTYVNLKFNYMEYKILEKSPDEIKKLVEKMIYSSEITIPKEISEGFYNDIYVGIEHGARMEGISIDEYINKNYNYSTYSEYIEANKLDYEYTIKKDMIYQKLASDLKIPEISKSDVMEYFAERIEAGDTYEDLITIYGEELMYKYTLQNKVEEILLEKLDIKER